MNVKHTTAEGRRVAALVVEGTVRAGLHRAAIMREQLNLMREESGEDVKVMVIENLLRLNTFPSCVVATTEFSDSLNGDLTTEDMTFDDFLDLPEQFLSKWATKVFDLNPSWRDDAVGPWLRPSRTEKPKQS